MTSHFFENGFVKLHYYKFGNGPRPMLCFHGFGMHGRQFRLMEEQLGGSYTFFGFDLFFHKETVLKDQSLQTVKAGLQKRQLAALVEEFCKHEGIERFSVIGYSMGTHYATAIAEELPERIDAYIIAAPSSIEPGRLVRFFGRNTIGNKLLERLMLSKRATTNLIRLFRKLRFIDEAGQNILYNEVGTPELRFALYACFTYLRYLETDEPRLIRALTTYRIKSIFIFGRYDKMYLPAIGKSFFSRYNTGKVLILDENHEMINRNFVSHIANLLP